MKDKKSVEAAPVYLSSVAGVGRLEISSAEALKLQCLQLIESVLVRKLLELETFRLSVTQIPVLKMFKLKNFGKEPLISYIEINMDRISSVAVAVSRNEDVQVANQSNNNDIVSFNRRKSTPLIVNFYN